MTQARLFGTGADSTAEEAEDLPPPIFICDTNVPMWLDCLNKQNDLCRYTNQEQDAIWAGIGELIKAKRLILIGAVKEELKGLYPMGLTKLLAYGTCRCPNKNYQIRQALKPYAEELHKPHWDRDCADPWVITYAKLYGYTVLTDEELGKPKKIPTVCDRDGIPWIGLTALARTSGWI